MSDTSALQESANSQSRLLSQQLAACESERIVFAESCTSGLVAALLGQNPGISSYLCGSAVTYRESVKIGWLNVSEDTLQEHTAESAQTTCEMAVGVLEETAEATISAAVTGHLGPNAPPEIDGKIFIAVARKGQSQEPDSIDIVSSESHSLSEETRSGRQIEAASLVLATCVRVLGSESE